MKMSIRKEDFKVSDTISMYLETVRQARSPHTAATYANALKAFDKALSDHDIHINELPITELSEDSISMLASYLKSFAPTTEALYLTATAGFFEFLVAENLASINMHRIRLLIHQRARRPVCDYLNFPAIRSIKSWKK